jgi:hypothetical protein
MSTKEAYKQKIEAELELAQARLAQWNAKAKVMAADGNVEYAKRVEELEQKVQSTRAKLKELTEAGEDAWESLKSGVESAWGSLSSGIRDAASKFKD